MRERRVSSASSASAEAVITGGDGIAIARILFLHGYRAEIFLAGKQEKFHRGNRPSVPHCAEISCSGCDEPGLE